jgi:hypothetical protein
MKTEEKLNLLQEIEELLSPDDRPGELIQLIAEGYLSGKEPDRPKIQQVVTKMLMRPEKAFIARSLIQFYELDGIEA